MKKIALALAVVAVAFAAAACSKKEETPGQKVDKMLDDAKDKADELKKK